MASTCPSAPGRVCRWPVSIRMWPSAVCLTPKGASEGDDVPTSYSRTLTCMWSPKPPCQKFGHPQVAMLGGSSGHTQGLWSLAWLRSLLTTALTASGLSRLPDVEILPGPSLPSQGPGYHGADSSLLSRPPATLDCSTRECETGVVESPDIWG